MTKIKISKELRTIIKLQLKILEEEEHEQLKSIANDRGSKSQYAIQKMVDLGETQGKITILKELLEMSRESSFEQELDELKEHLEYYKEE